MLGSVGTRYSWVVFGISLTFGTSRIIVLRVPMARQQTIPRTTEHTHDSTNGNWYWLMRFYWRGDLAEHVSVSIAPESQLSVALYANPLGLYVRLITVTMPTLCNCVANTSCRSPYEPPGCYFCQSTRDSSTILPPRFHLRRNALVEGADVGVTNGHVETETLMMLRLERRGCRTGWGIDRIIGLHDLHHEPYVLTMTFSNLGQILLK